MRSLILSLTVVLTFHAAAQHVGVDSSPEDSVKAAVNRFFTALRTGDKPLFFASMSDSALLQTISRDNVGHTVVQTESIIEFGELVGTLKKDSADERIVFDVIRIDGPLAMAWTPYEFYLNGKFSHCGVNSFNLVRVDGDWKIQYVIDTRRKTACK